MEGKYALRWLSAHLKLSPVFCLRSPFGRNPMCIRTHLEWALAVLLLHEWIAFPRVLFLLTTDPVFGMFPWCQKYLCKIWLQDRSLSYVTHNFKKWKHFSDSGLQLTPILKQEKWQGGGSVLRNEWNQGPKLILGFYDLVQNAASLFPQSSDQGLSLDILSCFGVLFVVVVVPGPTSNTLWGSGGIPEFQDAWPRQVPTSHESVGRRGFNHRIWVN